MGIFKEIHRRFQPLLAQRDASRLLEEGVPATAIVRAITDDTRPRGSASWFRMGLDLEVRQGGRQPYRVANDYLTPSAAELQVGTELPVRVDADDPAAIAIDWDNAPKKPAQGEIRPA